MPAVVLQQVSSAFARKNAGGTLDKPVAIRFLARHLSAEVLDELNITSPDGTIRIWGARYERAHQYFKMPPRESIVLFRRGKTVFAHGAVAATTINESLAESLWGRDESGETWPLIFFLKRLALISKPAAKLNLALGRKESDNWQGMTVLYLKDSPKLQEYFAKELQDVA